MSQRVISELYERVDFQKESIDGLRETLHEVMRDRDSWRGVAEWNGRVSGNYAAEAQRAERAIRSCESALMEAQAQRDALQGAIDLGFKAATAATMTRLEMAAHLRPFTTEHRAQYVHSAWSKPEVSEIRSGPLP
ncbi:hypothetical protein [Methylobacterium sp. WCS2018Hpa-22]|uniref:hypothetical protein n=1 Tax=Methylobacterium sp. WCS2018Hpa-22 TaxID=3073633 RepID=UPI00288B8EA2|nr:hypothetical protein [Methylobacterium sp. WCS2018Hpa-22]